jgi:8-oxo-dGTP pyrophosphatase MutT (NUDIX family)
MPIAKEALLLELRDHSPSDDHERDMWQTVIRFVEHDEQPFSPTNPNGHVTASAWIVSPDGRHALLTHHAKLHAWFQLGGHIDAHDNSALDAALREAREESGLADIAPVTAAIFDIDVHRIPARGAMPAHPHHDIRYLLRADPDQPLAATSESRALRWVALDEIAALNPSESIQRMVRKSPQATSSSVRANPA